MICGLELSEQVQGLTAVWQGSRRGPSTDSTPGRQQTTRSRFILRSGIRFLSQHME